jgi:putative transposase
MPLLGGEDRRDLLLQTLEGARRRYRFVVSGYVVMPEHVHLLVSEPQRASLSTVIQALKLGFVRRSYGSGDNLVPRSRKTGETWGTQLVLRHFWQARFYDFNVWTEHKRVEKLRYLHRNPVKRGLVASPELWRWSSFRWYCFGETGPVRINDTDILVMKIRPPAASQGCPSDLLGVHSQVSQNRRDLGHPAERAATTWNGLEQADLLPKKLREAIHRQILGITAKIK